MALLSSGSFTKVQINHLNNSNRAADDIKLGTFLDKLNNASFVSGSYTVTGTDSGGSKITLSTGLGTVKGYILDGFRSGSKISGLYVISNSGGSIVFSGGSAVPQGDVYNWIAW